MTTADAVIMRSVNAGGTGWCRDGSVLRVSATVQNWPTFDIVHVYDLVQTYGEASGTARLAPLTVGALICANSHRRQIGGQRTHGVGHTRSMLWWPTWSPTTMTR